MTPTTKTIPASMIHTPWMPDYCILGNTDYRCFRRLSLNDLMEIESEGSSEKDKVFVLRLKTASLATNAIIRKLIYLAHLKE